LVHLTCNETLLFCSEMSEIIMVISVKVTETKFQPFVDLLIRVRNSQELEELNYFFCCIHFQVLITHYMEGIVPAIDDP